MQKQQLIPWLGMEVNWVRRWQLLETAKNFEGSSAWDGGGREREKGKFLISGLSYESIVVDRELVVTPKAVIKSKLLVFFRISRVDQFGGIILHLDAERGVQLGFPLVKGTHSDRYLNAHYRTRTFTLMIIELV